MRSRISASFGWATLSRGYTSFYAATFSGREVLRSPGVNNCVFDWTPSDADGETFTSRPSWCGTVCAPESGSSAGTPSRRRA